MPLVFQRAPPLWQDLPFSSDWWSPPGHCRHSSVYPRIRDPGLEDQPGAGPEQATDGQFLSV